MANKNAQQVVQCRVTSPAERAVSSSKISGVSGMPAMNSGTGGSGGSATKACNMLASALIEDTSRAEHTELALKAGARSIDTRGGFGRVAAEKGVLVQQKHLTNPVV